MLSFLEKVDGALLLSVQFRFYNTEVKSPVIKLFRSSVQKYLMITKKSV